MNFRRYYFTGQIVFISQNLKDRRKVFKNPQMITLLRNTLHLVKEKHTFQMLAYVFLPDHFHLLIQPTGDSNFSQIMHSLKSRFTRTYKREHGISARMNLWQKRFWDHVIRDEEDLENHIHYIHYNPVKHGYVKSPIDWDHSSYQHWLQLGAYEGESEWEELKNERWGE